MFDKETSQLITKARTLGSKELTVYLEDRTLIRLCAVVAADVERHDLVEQVAGADELAKGYYSTPLEWFDRPVREALPSEGLFSDLAPEGVAFEGLFLALREEVEDFTTYFKNLCEVHKRRLKFKLILENQPLPKMEPIVPRSLLEYGMRPPEALASWLVWRKWLYDVDNRSAQETGYLFEPILAASIGGDPFPASSSPVRRANDRSKGRQVDCIKNRLAYEFKMRVTIAASGQGRFKEELDFARDCHESNYSPVLVVLDPTPSPRLQDLSEEYERYGGSAYVGDEAWDHLAGRAGEVMGRFVDRYVRKPLEEVETSHTALQPIRLAETDDGITVQVGTESFSFPRGGDAQSEE